MSEFKVGDKVRATEKFVQETKAWHEERGFEVPRFVARVMQGETLEIARVDPADSDLPYPLGAQFVEGEKYADWLADNMAFETDELEHIED